MAEVCIHILLCAYCSNNILFYSSLPAVDATDLSVDGARKQTDTIDFDNKIFALFIVVSNKDD